MGILEFIGLILGIISSLITISSAIRVFISKGGAIVEGLLGVGMIVGLWIMGTVFFSAMASTPVVILVMIVDPPLTMQSFATFMLPVAAIISIAMAVYLAVVFISDI